MRLLLATRNRHKTGELSALLAGLSAEVLCADDVPGLPEVDEDQPTLEGNARKKALAAARASGLWSLADDTGLEVAALNGAPGVFSARYAGPGCDFAANNRKLLAELSGVPAARRAAVFRTVMALAGPEGEPILEEGRLEGVIAAAPSGEKGFGYDPVFFVPQAGKTLAQMSGPEKNALSHRGEALRRMLPHLRRLLAPAALLLALLLATPARAGRTEPGQETIWDRIMASQARRDLRVGSRYLDEGRYDLALREFEAAVEASPKDPLSRMMLGAARYWNGDVDKALQDYDKALELEPQNAQAHMLRGIALAWKGDVKGAHAAFITAGDLDIRRADIQMNLGSIEDALGNVPMALMHFRRAVNMDPEQPLYHFQLGMLYRRLGRDPEAAESFEKAIRFFPRFEDAWLELGALEERRGEKKAAVRDFRKAVDLKNRDSVARLRLARIYLMMGQSKKAREVLAEAFHLTPEEGGGGLQLSVAYSGAKSKQAPKPASSSRPSPSESAPKPPPAPEPQDPLDVFGRNLERIPLGQSARMQVEIAFVSRPKLVRASPESASALKKALQKEVTPEPNAPQAVRREYQLRAAEGPARDAQIAGILKDLRKIMASAPPDSDVRFGMNLLYTRLHEGQDRSPAEDAKVSYQPRQVGNDLGLWVMGTGWMALVEEVLPEPGEKPSHPDQSDWWVATGLAHAVIGQSQEAGAAFERACRLDPGNEAAFLGRAVAAVLTGQEAAAISALEAALQINPKNKAAREGLKWLKRPSASKQASARSQ